MNNEPLEDRIEQEKPKRTSWKEYGRFFSALEIGAIIGNQVGIHGSSYLTDSNLPRTGGTLSGDYIGGLFGFYLSYWYNNWGKFKDESRKFNYKEFIKDSAKLILMDWPVTSFTYLISGNITYQLVKHDVNETVIGFVSWFSTMIIYHSIYYHVYDAIKYNKDEKLVGRLYMKIKNNYLTKLSYIYKRKTNQESRKLKL